MAYNQKQPLGQLPEHHYEADREWINKMLGYLNDGDRAKVCKAYSKAFYEAASLEPITHKKTNRGRFEANTRLRKFIEKRFRVFNQ